MTHLLAYEFHVSWQNFYINNETKIIRYTRIFNKENISFDDYDRNFKFISFVTIFITFKYNYYFHCYEKFCCVIQSRVELHYLYNWVFYWFIIYNHNEKNNIHYVQLYKKKPHNIRAYHESEFLSSVIKIYWV